MNINFQLKNKYQLAISKYPIDIVFFLFLLFVQYSICIDALSALLVFTNDATKQPAV